MAAGYYDGFFETGLNPWDMAAGSLIITEAGGLIGNFTGESDFLYQREVVAGNAEASTGRWCKSCRPTRASSRATSRQGGRRAGAAHP